MTGRSLVLFSSGIPGDRSLNLWCIEASGAMAAKLIAIRTSKSRKSCSRGALCRWHPTSRILRQPPRMSALARIVE